MRLHIHGIYKKANANRYCNTTKIEMSYWQVLKNDHVLAPFYRRELERFFFCLIMINTKWR